jgi:hypothetical protein
MQENTMNKHGSATVALDEQTAGYLEEINRAVSAHQAEIGKLMWQVETALQLFIRGQKLDGQWKLMSDMKTIGQVDGNGTEPNIAQKNPRKRK